MQVDRFAPRPLSPECARRRCGFDLCRVKDARRRTCGVVATSGVGERRAWLEDAVALIRQAFPRSAARPGAVIRGT